MRDMNLFTENATEKQTDLKKMMAAKRNFVNQLLNDMQEYYEMYHVEETVINDSHRYFNWATQASHRKGTAGQITITEEKVTYHENILCDWHQLEMIDHPNVKCENVQDAGFGNHSVTIDFTNISNGDDSRTVIQLFMRFLKLSDHKMKLV